MFRKKKAVPAGKSPAKTSSAGGKKAAKTVTKATKGAKTKKTAAPPSDAPSPADTGKKKEKAAKAPSTESTKSAAKSTAKKKDAKSTAKKKDAKPPPEKPAPDKELSGDLTVVKGEPKKGIKSTTKGGPKGKDGKKSVKAAGKETGVKKKEPTKGKAAKKTPKAMSEGPPKKEEAKEAETPKDAVEAKAAKVKEPKKLSSKKEKAAKAPKGKAPTKEQAMPSKVPKTKPTKMALTPSMSMDHVKLSRLDLPETTGSPPKTPQIASPTPDSSIIKPKLKIVTKKPTLEKLAAAAGDMEGPPEPLRAEGEEVPSAPLTTAKSEGAMLLADMKIPPETPRTKKPEGPSPAAPEPPPAPPVPPVPVAPAVPPQQAYWYPLDAQQGFPPAYPGYPPAYPGYPPMGGYLPPACEKCPQKDKEMEDLQARLSSLKKKLEEKEEEQLMGGPAVRALLKEIESLNERLNSEEKEYTEMLETINTAREGLHKMHHDVDLLKSECEEAREAARARIFGQHATSFACPLQNIVEKWVGRYTCLLSPRHVPDDCPVCRRRFDMRDIPLLA